MSILQTISTYLDIVDLIPQLYDEEEQDFTVLNVPRIRECILRNDRQLLSQLKPYFGSNLTVTPRVTQSVPRFGNSGDGVLRPMNPTGTKTLSVDTSKAVYSQVYQITFGPSDEVFLVESDLSGPQGDGDTSTDFTTTDGILVVAKELWDGSFPVGDVHHVKVYNYEGMLVHLSSLLAASNILDTIFTEEVPDASATAQRYERLYNRLIRALQDGIIFLEKALVARNLNPIQCDYKIDKYGRDITEYADFEWSPTGVE